MIRFSCPQCKLVLQAAEAKIGSVTACPKCGKRMKVPDGPTKAKLAEGQSSQRFSVDQAVAGDWFYSKDKKKVGPVSMDDIKRLFSAGQLQSSDLVFKTGMQKWLPLSGVLDLLPGGTGGAQEGVRPGSSRPSSSGLAAVQVPAPSAPGLAKLPATSAPRPDSGAFKPPALAPTSESAEDLGKTPLPHFVADDAAGARAVGKRRRPSKQRKSRRAAKSNWLLRAFIPAWLSIMLFRTVVLLQFEPKLSLFLWPIEWLAGLIIAVLSFRRRLYAGVVAGLLGPVVVLAAMVVFVNMGISKEEGLEHLRLLMAPYPIIALLLGLLLLRGTKRRVRSAKPAKAARTLKKRRHPSTMQMEAPAQGQTLADDGDTSAMGAVSPSRETE